MKKIKPRVQASIPHKYFISSKNAAGTFSWTLTAMLGDMLIMAEDLFGPRDKEYTILGVEFTASGPCCWNLHGGKYVIIQLSIDALGDQEEAYLEMAHECVHVLSPTGKRDANVLEEGLAVYFARIYMEQAFGVGWWNGELFVEDYRQAYTAVSSLLLIDKDVIKKLRIVEPTIAQIRSDLILTACPLVSQELAEELTRPFYKL